MFRQTRPNLKIAKQSDRLCNQNGMVQGPGISRMRCESTLSTTLSVYPESTRSLPGVYPESTRSLPGVYPESTRSLPGVYPVFVAQAARCTDARRPIGSIGPGSQTVHKEGEPKPTDGHEAPRNRSCRCHSCHRCCNMLQDIRS